MISLASRTMPAGMASMRDSRLISIRLSKLITFCRLAKKAATITPKNPPRVKINPLRRLLLLFVKVWSFAVGIKVTGSSLTGDD